jgi:poly-beta-1,6-N-acetyl-D-glucosamine synthase
MTRYAVITPVRNEQDHVRSLAAALAAQTSSPARWVITDNGSTDATEATVRELAARYSWATLLDTGHQGELMRGGPIVRAFHAGIEHLDFEPDIVVKLDADITFEADYFERLLTEFEKDDRLGIASGSCYERDPEGTWRQRHGTGAGVWGANRAYRWECLRELLPLEERMGWDTLDLLKASVHGWRTKVVEELPFRHHRPEGVRDGSRMRAWASQGRAAHYMGYRFTYLLARTLYRALRDPAALALLAGYAAAALRREPFCSDAALRASVRQAQSWRQMPARIREARRPRAAMHPGAD